MDIIHCRDISRKRPFFPRFPKTQGLSETNKPDVSCTHIPDGRSTAQVFRLRVKLFGAGRIRRKAIKKMQTECKLPANCSMKVETTLPAIPNHHLISYFIADALSPKKGGKLFFVFRGSYCRFLSARNSSAPTMAIMIARATPTPIIVIVLSGAAVAVC